MSIALNICEQIRAYIASDPVAAALGAVYAQTWDTAVRYEFVEDATELDTLDVSIVPGELSHERVGREVARTSFTVGVSLTKRIEPAEIPALADFAETLFFALQQLPTSRPEHTRGVELAEVRTETVYSNKTLDTVRTFDALIVLSFNIFYKKGGIS